MQSRAHAGQIDHPSSRLILEHRQQQEWQQSVGSQKSSGSSSFDRALMQNGQAVFAMPPSSEIVRLQPGVNFWHRSSPFHQRSGIKHKSVNNVWASCIRRSAIANALSQGSKPRYLRWFNSAIFGVVAAPAIGSRMSSPGSE